MKASAGDGPTYPRLFPRIIITILTLVIFSVAPSILAQSGREQVECVKNFERVTDRYFRGRVVTPDGIRPLAEMEVRAIIDLRDDPNADEPAICQRNGITYFNFPMTGHDAPNDKAVNEVLSIIQNTKEPVYAYCTAGERRAGTTAALYRTRNRSWSKDRVWAERQSYGFGATEESPGLYAYVYGSRADRGASSARSASDDKDRDRSSSKENSGAGLGLPIARWIAEAHGGQISLGPSDLCGSVFVITLPVRRQSFGSPARSEEQVSVESKLAGVVTENIAGCASRLPPQG